MSRGSDGLYLPPLPDMSPATFDCPEPSDLYFSYYRVCVCVDFSGSFYFTLIFHNVDPFGVVINSL